MLHTKFQASEHSSSGEDVFSTYYFRTQDSPPQGCFGPHDYHLYILGRCLLNNASYQISKPLAYWFQRCCLKQIVDDGRRTQPLADGNSSP